MSSELELLLLAQIESAGLEKPVEELVFHPTRKWRFDFCWPDIKLAVEVEGGTWSGGRHTSGKGFEADCEKYAEAAILGWTIIRITSSMINKADKSGILKGIHYIETLYRQRKDVLQKRCDK